MRLAVIAGAIVLASASCGNAQVVVDSPVANFNAVKSLYQDVKSYALQGQQALMQAQMVAQEVQTYQSFVQNPSLGSAMGIINQAGLGNDLPVNPYAVMSLMSGSSKSLSGISSQLSALKGLVNESYFQNHIHDCTNQSWACEQQKQNAYALAGRGGAAAAVYKNIRDHMPVLQALRDRAATATTPAERNNIEIQLQAETAWHNSQIAQFNAIQGLGETNQLTLVQRDNEKASRDLEAVVSEIPGG